MAWTLNMRGLIALEIRIEDAMNTDLGFALADAVDVAADDAVTQLHDASPLDMAPNNGVIPGEAGHLDESFSATDAEITGQAQASCEVLTAEPIKFQYVTQGTASPIVPATKQAMWWPDAGIPRRRVRGQIANPFQEEVAALIQAKAPDYFEQAIALLRLALRGS